MYLISWNKYVVVTDCVTGISLKMGLKGKLNKAFLHFLPYLMIFQTEVCLRLCQTLKNQNCGKNLRKALFNLPFKPRFSADSGYLILHYSRITMTVRRKTFLRREVFGFLCEKFKMFL